MADAQKATLHGYPVEVGDRVWHLGYGWGEITAVRNGSIFVFKNADFCGLCWPWEIFWQPVEITPPPKPEPKLDWGKVPQGVRVIYDPGYYEMPHEQEGLFVCYTEVFGLPEYLVATSANKVERAINCRLAPGVEVKKEWLK